MAETAPREEIGRLIADMIFSKFGWKQAGPYNQNFECVELDLHKKQRAKSHAGDVIFYYPDPYLGMDVYLHCDLKCYGAASIESSDLKKWVRDLAIAVDCANKSPAWARLYDQTDGNHTVYGLLFIYNHDHGYDRDYKSVMMQAGNGISQLPEGKRLFVIGPEDALYLYNVARDIATMQGDKKLPIDDAHFSFCHPDLENTPVQTNKRGPATVEMLLGPWQVLHFHDTSKAGSMPGYVIYYRGTGGSVEEFLYLLDYIFCYQLLGDRETIEIRLPFGLDDCANTFAKTKKKYGEEFWPVEADSQQHFQERLKRISCVLCPQRFPQVSTKALAQ
jgi:hypothetical protein